MALQSLSNEIRYTVGDATRPEGIKRVIAHVCNDVGAWGAGFVMSLSKRWKLPENEYHRWNQGYKLTPFQLGEIDVIGVDHRVWVANMIAQRGIGIKDGPALCYHNLRECLNKLTAWCLRQAAFLPIGDTPSVHMPRIGCGLAGGKWESVQPIINETLIAAGVEVVVYDLA